jgi:pullulanase
MDMTGKTAAEVAEQAAAMNKLAAAYYITAQGVPFIHAGEEMLRSKPDAQQESGFNHNSYAAGDVINSIKWNTLADELVDNTHDYYQGLIAFRAAHDAMRMTTEAEILSAMSAVDAGSNDVIVLLNKGGNGEKAEILSIFNADAAEQTVTLPEGKWEVYVNGELAGTTVLETVAGTVTVSGTSAMILVKAAEEEPEVTEPTAPEATTKPGTGDNAQTADAFNMVWFAVLAVSAVATVALMAARKKLF